MDLRFTPAQEAFRHEARGWLAAHAPAPGSLPSLDTADGFEAHRRWSGHVRGSLVGGVVAGGVRRSGVGILEWLIFEEEYWRAQAPSRVSQNGVPAGAHHVRVRDRPAAERFLPAMASGEEIWCQGWSEPDAGATWRHPQPGHPAPSGDGWLLSGQKTWASRGAFAEWCFGLFRTDPEANGTGD